MNEVIVLAGGISHEREISLRSGRRVADALTTAGHSVTVLDPDAHLFERLKESAGAVVWPVVHGSSGEDGALLDLLRASGHAYVGPAPEAARLAWHKPTAKTLLYRAGLVTPESITLARETFRELGATAVLNIVVATLGQNLVVKPAQGGSAQGVSIVSAFDDLPRAMVEAFTYCEEALIERCMTGTEISVTVIDTGDGPRALPAVEIVPLDGVYSFEARYNAGETTFYAPARLRDNIAETAASASLTACATLGLSALSRVDLIVDDAGVPWILEANAIPGLTETSLVPLAIEAAGLDVAATLTAVLRASAGQH